MEAQAHGQAQENAAFGSGPQMRAEFLSAAGQVLASIPEPGGTMNFPSHRPAQWSQFCR